MYKINAYIVKFDVKSATCMVFKKQKQRQKKLRKHVGICWPIILKLKQFIEQKKNLLLK